MTGLLRLEVAAVMRARWLALASALSVLLVLFFVALASRESSVLAFTGFDRVVTGAGLAALMFLPLLAVFSTSQVVAQARQQGVLEWYLSHPVSRASCFWALFVPRVLAVCGPIAGVVLLLGVGATVLGQGVPLALLGRLFLLLAGQGFCFAALGMLVGVSAKAPEQALLSALGIWMGAVALVDFALIAVMLRWRLPHEAVFALSGLNPIQAGRLGLLVGSDPDLGLLGPVGTWIAIHLGGSATLAYGLAWPIVIGAAALALSRALFVRRDLS